MVNGEDEADVTEDAVQPSEPVAARKVDVQEVVSIHTTGHISDQCVFLNEDRFVPVPTDDERWYFDSGASNHMTGSRKMLTKLDESIRGTVKFGDGSVVQIHGRGTVVFTCRNGEHRALTGVYYIPRLRTSIISLGQLDEVGCKSEIGDGELKLFDRQRSLLARPQGYHERKTVCIRLF
jgi:hypothetical protein